VNEVETVSSAVVENGEFNEFFGTIFSVFSLLFQFSVVFGIKR